MAENGKIFNRDVRIGGGGELYVGERKVINRDGELLAPVGIQLADGGAIEDTNGNELIKAAVVASAVNEITVRNAATGNAPLVASTGDDTNIDFVATSKGTGGCLLKTGAGARTVFEAANTASSVNYVKTVPGATGTGARIASTGTDANVDLMLTGKGTGFLDLTSPTKLTSIETLTGAGAASVSKDITVVVTTGANALTLAAGTEGQIKRFVMLTDAGDGTLTPTNLIGGTTITFNDVGDTCTLLYTQSKWFILSNFGCTVA